MIHLNALFFLTMLKLIFNLKTKIICGRIGMSHFYKLFTIVLLLPLMAFAGSFGSRGLIHVQSASTLNKGTLDFRSNLYFYTKVGDFLGDTKPTNFTAVNWWDVQSNALFSYGILDYLDATMMWGLYQDTNRKGNEYNSPEDLYLDLKAGSLSLSNNRFHLGVLTSVRIPTQTKYNYAFEPYAAGSVEFGFTGLFSFFNDPYLHDRSFALHANLGWYNHNDAGQELYTTPSGTVFKASGNATELQYGLGISYPTELFNLNLEWWGAGFINEPDTMAYSRENYMYVTPSIKFKPKPWFNFDLGIDIRLSGTDNTTSSLIPDPTQNLDLPNYPSWKMYLGLNFTLMPLGFKGGAKETGTVRSKVDFYENLLKERQKSRNVEEELRRLKKEREQAEKELEELRQMLEEQGK